MLTAAEHKPVDETTAAAVQNAELDQINLADDWIVCSLC